MPKTQNSHADEDSDDHYMDDDQFKHFLHKMFPNSKNLKNKIREMDKITKKMDEKEKENSSNDESEESNSESDDEYDQFNNFNKQPINIIVTMGGMEDFDDYSDDDEYIPNNIDDLEYYSDDDDDWTDTEDEEENFKITIDEANLRKPMMTRSKKKELEKNENVTEKKETTNPKKPRPAPEKPTAEKKEKPTADKKEKPTANKKEKTIVEILMEKINENDNENEIENKIKFEMQEYLKGEKNKLELIEKEKKEKEEKKTKIKNEKTFRKLLNRRKNINSFDYFKKQTIQQQKMVIEKFQEIEENNKIEKPYSFIIAESQLPLSYKTIAIKKLKMFESMEPGASDYYKNKLWVDTFMEIPFSKYAKLPVTLGTSTDEEIIDFMEMSMKTLDNVVYGLDDAKMQIMQIIGKWIANPDCLGNAFAINGPPGTGKTTLIKDGISKILNRPFAFIPLGGATDSSYLEGHSYTYEGSIWGKIVQILIDSKVMNPVIYFDELDKVSNSPRGEEIIGILTHLTDTSQNSQFHDKYFSGIDFDLSKALFIFSYNDESLINPILKDRMYRIVTKGYNSSDKQIISNKYILPNILKSINFKESDIIIDNLVMDYINQNLTENEKGVRNMKRCIETICSKLNLIRLSKNTKIVGPDINIDFKTPYKVTINDVQSLIKRNTSDYSSTMYT